MDTQLPEDFDGVFRFTNYTDEDFVTKWNNKEYTFPAMSTVPLIMPEHTPVEIQNIRKKFATDLATKMFYGSKEFKKMSNVPPGTTPALYTEKDIAPYVQKCLEPLPVGKLRSRTIPKPSDDRFTSKVLEGTENLKGEGTPVTD